MNPEGLQADYIKLDVTDNEEIKTVANYIDRTYGNLDILINNAGISIEKSPSYMVNNSESINEDTLGIVYQTNVRFNSCNAGYDSIINEKVPAPVS